MEPEEPEEHSAPRMKKQKENEGERRETFDSEESGMIKKRNGR